MDAPENKAELLRALGRLVRGLSALFWGMPLTLVVGVQTARTDWLRPLGILPSLLTSGLLLYGLIQMSGFQTRERPWRGALEWAKLLALINLGLSPFLFWWHFLPDYPFYQWMVLVLAANGLLFLYVLNVVLQRLAAMLPDETLRLETRFFAALDRYLILATLGFVFLYWAFRIYEPLPELVVWVLRWIEQVRLGFVVLLVLLPLSITMALLWKVKEVILSGVFSDAR
ncbi:MAG TPA: hypothetical protein P5186_08425 [Candidatus Paceibacterota bacterium]|nr:hypothetical protein [Verrucomicrobiota bacterium]HRY48057.1 hypothetical protein [Candidatus Paceibacterota bacterium]HSA02389.1 hypothetical protein [Candidatus Paceibacterota bacterium]